MKIEVGQIWEKLPQFLKDRDFVSVTHIRIMKVKSYPESFKPWDLWYSVQESHELQTWNPVLKEMCSEDWILNYHTLYLGPHPDNYDCIEVSPNISRLSKVE